MNIFRSGLGALVLLACGTVAAQTPLMLGNGEKDFARYGEYGIRVVVNGDLNLLATYDTVAPGLLPAGSDVRKDVEHARRSMKDICAKAAAQKLAICFSTDEAKFPVPVWEHLLKTAPERGSKNRIDLGSEEFWKFYRAKYREVLKAFPEVAYVMVRTGENYASHRKTFAGQTIRGKKIDDTYFANMQRLINETRRLVVDEAGRKLIWRTWDLGNEGFHANTNVYDRIFAGVTNRTGLLVAVKHTQTDYWQYNDFNPCIGRGGLDQIIEFQCAREYEGKGAYPNYVGVEHGPDLRHAFASGAKGVWCWDFGGGWGGPLLKNDLWVRLNIYATTRLAQHPELTPEAVAQEWAAKQFGGKAAAGVTAALLKSHACVRKMLYIEPYAQQHRGWLSSRNLTRDDIIRGEKDLRGQGGIKVIYTEIKPRLDRALKEKLEAVELARQMRTTFENEREHIVAERGQTTFDEALTGFIYLEKLSRVMSSYVRGMFLFYRSQETKAATDAKAALEELTTWQHAWTDYRAEIPKLPGAATLYRSQCDQEETTTPGAMADTCEKALAALKKR
jgi:hypothetical protein